MRNVTMVWAVELSRVFRIRRRSRIDGKQDLDTDEISSENVRDELKITPRLYEQRNCDIGGHEKSRIRYFRMLFRKTTEQKFILDWLREREEVCWHQSSGFVYGSYEMSDVKREVEGRKWDKKLNVIGLEMILDWWIRFEWAEWSNAKNEKKMTQNSAL